MIVFITFSILAFYCGSTFILFADETIIFKSSFLNILYSFDTNYSIFLLEVAFRNPNCAYIVYPNIMTSRNIIGIS